MDLQVLTIDYNERDLTVKGYYEEAEEAVHYYSDGSGYPGSPACFNITEIKLSDRDITNLLSIETIEEIEEICLEELH